MEVNVNENVSTHPERLLISSTVVTHFSPNSRHTLHLWGEKVFSETSTPIFTSQGKRAFKLKNKEHTRQLQLQSPKFRVCISTTKRANCERQVVTHQVTWLILWLKYIIRDLSFSSDFFSLKKGRNSITLAAFTPDLDLNVAALTLTLKFTCSLSPHHG